MEQTQNTARSNLTSSATSGDTTLTVANGAVFAATGRILVDSELMTLTNVSGNTLTVTRGQGGTTAASHSNGALVIQVISKEGFDAWLADARIIDTYANIPAAGYAGRMFIASDGCTIAIDNGSSWDHYGPIYPDLTPPIDGDFSWFNQGSATVSTSQGGVVITAPANASHNIRGRYKAKTAPYKVTAHFVPLFADANYPHCGIGFRSSVSDKALTIHVVNASNKHYVEVAKSTNSTTYLSSPTAFRADNTGHLVRWLQIEDDNTNLILRYSCNGKVWIDAFSEARGTFFSGGNLPTGPFFFANSVNATYPALMHLLHWLEE